MALNLKESELRICPSQVGTMSTAALEAVEDDELSLKCLSQGDGLVPSNARHLYIPVLGDPFLRYRMGHGFATARDKALFPH